MDPAPDQLHDLLRDLVRFGGLLHPDQADPGQPLALSQVFALHELDTPTPLSQTELAARLGLEKSTVSRLVTDLERAGLLTRERDPDNRRYYRLRITERGRAAHAAMSGGFHRRYERIAAAITGAERDALVTGLSALLRVLRQEPHTPAGPGADQDTPSSRRSSARSRS